MKKLFILAVILSVPFISSASSIPKFPMAFYGSVTINNVLAPTGAVIRAYYGNQLAGESVVDVSGVYGFASSTAKKLLIGEGSGPITFTFQTPSILSGQETSGSPVVSYSEFKEGVSELNDLNFSYSEPNTIVPTRSSSSGGGGGGGSRSTVSTIPVATGSLLASGVLSTSANTWTTLSAADKASIIKILQIQLAQILQILNDLITSGSLR